jgi:hypothetical protein
VVGVLLDDVAQAPAIGELVFAFFRCRTMRVPRWACRWWRLRTRPRLSTTSARLRRRQAGTAAVHVDLVGDDEGGEAHAELADQVRVLLLVAGEVLHEVGGAGLGDGAQVGDDVVAAHADAVVFEGDGGVLVEAHADFQVGVAFEQLRLGQGFEAQLVGGVGGVGDQLAQEDFLVGIQRVDHEVQQLLHLGLEAQGFLLSFHTHGLQTPI